MKELTAKYHWSIESFGSDYPPENADEIIARANELIDDFGVHEPYCGEDEVEYFASMLWETYCATGTLPVFPEDDEEV